MEPGHPQYVAFAGQRLLARGTLLEVGARLLREPLPVRGAALLFNATTSEPADIDFEGDDASVLDRIVRRERAMAGLEDTKRGRGRPRLGVVSREVTLLPRHWEWLSEQPGGASVALRRLVDEARREHVERDRTRNAREASYRFMSAVLGNAPHFEEATRALFAGDGAQFRKLVARWPKDLKAHLLTLADATFESEDSTGSED